MTFDHIGVFLDSNSSLVFRIIGRIAFPLFLFLTVEGALKTSNKKKYILRLSILAIGVGIILTIMSLMGGFYKEVAYGSGNIFIDLLLIVLSITILECDNKKIKPLVALSALYLIYSGIVMKLEGCGCHGLFTWHTPALRSQYGFYTLFLGFGFYFAKKISPKICSKFYNDELEQPISNALSVLVLVFSTIILFLINLAFGQKYKLPLNGIQSYAVLAGILIIFYNGKKGYNAKWFKVAYYLYYPIHIAIIALIFMMIGA